MPQLKTALVLLLLHTVPVLVTADLKCPSHRYLMPWLPVVPLVRSDSGVYGLCSGTPAM